MSFVLRRWKYAVEIGLVEAFPSCEHFFGRDGRREAELIGSYSYDRTIPPMYIDMVQLGMPRPCAPYFKMISGLVHYELYTKEFLLPFQARLPEARRGPGYLRSGEAYL